MAERAEARTVAVEFTDRDSGSEAAAIVRGSDGRVTLGLLINGSGDLDVALTLDDCARLVAALTAAVEQAQLRSA